MYDQSTLEPQHDPSAGYPVTPTRSGGVVVVVIGICLVAVLGLAAAGFLVFHGRSDSPTFSQASAKGAVPTSVAPDGSALPGVVDPASSVITGTDAGAPTAGGAQTGAQTGGQAGG